MKHSIFQSIALVFSRRDAEVSRRGRGETYAKKKTNKPPRSPRAISASLRESFSRRERKETYAEKKTYKPLRSPRETSASLREKRK